MAAVRTTPRGLLAVVAAMTVLTGCGSSDPVAETGSSQLGRPTTIVAATTADFNDLDPADGAFVAQLRAKGLAPNPNDFSDGVFVTDANAICRILAVPGETDEIKQTELLNMRSVQVTMRIRSPEIDRRTGQPYRTTMSGQYNTRNLMYTNNS